MRIIAIFPANFFMKKKLLPFAITYGFFCLQLLLQCTRQKACDA